VGLPEVGLLEVGAFKVGPLELGPVEVSRLEVGLHEIGPLELGPSEDGPLELGAFKVGPLELGLVEVSLLEVGLHEIGPLELGPSEVGPLELGLFELDPMELGVSQEDPPEVFVRKIDSREIRTPSVSAVRFEPLPVVLKDAIQFLSGRLRAQDLIGQRLGCLALLRALVDLRYCRHLPSTQCPTSFPFAHRFLAGIEPARGFVPPYRLLVPQQVDHDLELDGVLGTALGEDLASAAPGDGDVSVVLLRRPARIVLGHLHTIAFPPMPNCELARQQPQPLITSPARRRL
jgi:hypothetical protein